MEIRFTGVHCDRTCELTLQTLFWNVFVFIDKSAIIFVFFIATRHSLNRQRKAAKKKTLLAQWNDSMKFKEPPTRVCTKPRPRIVSQFLIELIHCQFFFSQSCWPDGLHYKRVIDSHCQEKTTQRRNENEFEWLKLIFFSFLLRRDFLIIRQWALGNTDLYKLSRNISRTLTFCRKRRIRSFVFLGCIGRENSFGGMNFGRF